MNHKAVGSSLLSTCFILYSNKNSSFGLFGFPNQVKQNQIVDYERNSEDDSPVVKANS